MSGPSKVIVLDPDPRAGRLVQLGFEREGIGIALATPGAPLDIPPEAGAILVGGNDGTSVDLVRQARAALQTANLDIPIIAASRGAARADLEAAGADAILTPPTYLRDVVTACRILHGVPSQKRDHLVGNLAETTGSYSLVRVFAALGKSGVLTLIRGLRRGEVRFYKGEVTSAELGVIHGQAAFHQILLWTDARFDFAHHEIVRRQQIPLSPEELFADAERFLEGVRDAAGGLSPATVLEQDVQRIQDLGKQIPTEVFGVLRMFDGHRVLADILEDSPYRVFETLRVAQKAVEVGLLRPVVSQRPKATWRAVLAIDEWLVGNETRDAVVERTVDLDTGSHPVQKPPKSRSKKSRHKRTSSPMPTAKTDIDWGALVPRVIGAEVGPLSGVVPALAAHGEVEAPTRDREREKLEALMDTDKRDRIFPTEIGLEPKVVIAGMEAESAPPASAVPDEVDTVSSGSKRNKKKKADKAAAEKARQEAEKMARAAAEAARIAGEKAMAEKAAAAEKAAMAKADAEREAKAKIAAEMARIEAERVATEQARLEAERMAAQKTAAEMAAVDAEQAAAAERVAKEKIAAEMARIEAARVANEKASAETARLEAERAAKERIAAEMARIEAERVARDEAATAEKLAAERAAAERAAAEKLAAERAAAERATAERAAADRAAEAKAAAEAARAAEEKAFADKAPRSAADRAAADRAAADRAAADRAAAEQAAAEREIAESQSRVHENVERMRLDRLARDEADARAAAEAALSANAHAVEDARAYAARVKAAAEARRLEAERSRNEAVIDAAHASPREGGASSDARDLVRRLVADAVPPGASSSTASAAPPAEPAFLTTPPSDVDVAASRLVATPTSDAARASSTSDAANRLVATPTSDVAARGLVATPTSDAAARGLVATPTSDAAARGLVATPTSDAARATSSSDAADRLVASPMSGDTMRGVIPSSTSDAAANRLIATPTSDAAANRLIATPHDTDRGIIATPTSDAAANRLVATPHDTDRGIIATPTSDAASNRLIATPTSGDTERNIAVPMTGDTARGIVAASSGPAPTATSGATTLPHHSSSSDDALTRPFVRAEALMTDPVTVSEAGNTSVAVSDVVTVNRTSDTAMVTASPRVIISESVPASEMASTARAVSASSTIDRDDATTGRDDATTGRDDATPEETDDEPSDGVIRATIATADTARVAARARAMRPPEPEHDGPPVKEATGEIGDRRVRTGIQEKIELEPSILVNDLAAAHSAASAAVTKSAATPAPGDAASASKELDVATVRRDAVAFSADEEAFFKRAEGGTSQVPKFESFDDLDEGYEPTSFWGRVFGNKDKKKPPR